MAVQPPPASSLVGKKVVERVARTPADPGYDAFDLRRAAWRSRDETAGDRLDHDRPSTREDAKANREATRERGICSVLPYRDNTKDRPKFFARALYAAGHASSRRSAN